LTAPEGAARCRRGLVHKAVLQRMAALAGTDLRVVTHRICTSRCAPGMAVTTCDGQPCTWFGAHMPYDDRTLQFQGCLGALEDEVCSAWQVAVVDPVWGRNEVLWPLLDRVASQTPALAAGPVAARG
jgi:hypothetical protein